MGGLGDVILDEVVSGEVAVEQRLGGFSSTQQPGKTSLTSKLIKSLDFKSFLGSHETPF